MPDSIQRKRLFTFFKILVGFGLLLLSIRGIEWNHLSTTFKSVQPLWLVGVFVSMVCSVLLKVARWVLLMNKYGLQISFRRVSEAYFLGQVVNIVLPARGGDVVRLGIVSAQDPTIIPRATATIALEKFVDLIALALIALAVSAYLPSEADLWLRQWLLPVSGLTVVGLLIIIFIGPLLWSKIERQLSRFTHPWILRGVKLMNGFVHSSLWLRKISNMLPIILLTILIWGFMSLNSLILFRALGLTLPIAASGLVLVLGYVRAVLQLPPGSVGPFYFFAQLGVTTFGAPPETALAFAILLHAIVTLTPILISAFLVLTSDDIRSLTQLIWRPNAAKTG